MALSSIKANIHWLDAPSEGTCAVTDYRMDQRMDNQRHLCTILSNKNFFAGFTKYIIETIQEYYDEASTINDKYKRFRKGKIERLFVSEAQSLLHSAGDDYLISHGPKAISLINNGKLVTYEMQLTKNTPLHFQYTGEHLFFAGTNDDVHMYGIENGACTHMNTERFAAPTTNVTSLRYDSTRSVLIVGGANGLIAIYNPQGGSTNIIRKNTTDSSISHVYFVSYVQDSNLLLVVQHASATRASDAMDEVELIDAKTKNSKKRKRIEGDWCNQSKPELVGDRLFYLYTESAPKLRRAQTLRCLNAHTLEAVNVPDTLTAKTTEWSETPIIAMSANGGNLVVMREYVSKFTQNAVNEVVIWNSKSNMTTFRVELQFKVPYSPEHYMNVSKTVATDGIRCFYSTDLYLWRGLNHTYRIALE